MSKKLTIVENIMSANAQLAAQNRILLDDANLFP